MRYERGFKPGRDSYDLNCVLVGDTLRGVDAAPALVD